MVFELSKVIYSALGFGFTAVQKIFSGVGLPWVSAVCVMVLVSVVLRLFTTRFIGNAIGSMARGDKQKKTAQNNKKGKDS